MVIGVLPGLPESQPVAPANARKGLRHDEPAGPPGRAAQTNEPCRAQRLARLATLRSDWGRETDQSERPECSERASIIAVN